MKDNLVEKLNSLLEKNVPTNPSKWSYYKSQAKKKFDVYPSAYANAWAAKKYKAAGGGWKKESVNEDKLPNKYIGNNNIVYLKTGEFNRSNGGKGATYNLYWKGHQISGPFNFGTKESLEDFADEFILSRQKYNMLRYKDEKPLPESVTEQYYDSLKPHDGYIDAEKLIGKRLWFHTNRSHAIQGRNGMVGIYTVTSNGTKKSLTKNYTNEVRLKSPIHFQTSESGAKRIQKSKETQGGAGKRILIAGVSGVVIPTKSGNLSGMQQARFNPFDKQAPWFHLVSDSDKKEIVSADEVYFRADENTPDNMRWYIYVKNPKFSGKSKKELKKESKMNLKEWTKNYVNSLINEDLPTKEIDPKQFPNPLPSSKKGFLKKGNYDGEAADDIVATKPVQISVSKLKPSQSAIYLGKALGMAVGGVEGGDLGAVISKDNYILDGHHRYAATTFNNPSAKVGGVQSDLMIGDLVPVLRAVGDAMKNKRGLAPKGGDVNIFKATMKDVKDAIYNGKNMDSKFYNKEKSIAWFENIGEETIAKRLKMLQSKMPPSGAPARKDMPKIKPSQLGILKTLLNKGNIDVRKPYAESVNEELDIKVDSIFKRNFYWVADNKDGKILASAKTKAELMKQLKQAAEKGLVKLEAVKKKNSVNEAMEPDVITQLRDIVSSKQNKKIKDPKSGKKMAVDLYSASAVTQVYDALKQSNKDKFVSQGLVGMVNLAFKLLKKESVNEATEWYEIDEWKERLEKAISKSNLNPKEKRYLQLRAYKIRSKHDAVDILNDLDDMESKNESVNESMLSPKAAKKLKIGDTIKTQNGTYKITGYGQKTNATRNFEAEKDGERYNLRVSLRGTTSIEVAKGRSLNFTDSEMLESVNEVMDKTQLRAIYDKLQKGDELTIMYTDMWSGKTRGNFIVKKGKTKVGKARVERITLINKNNPRGVRYYLYQRNGFVTFAVGDMAATIDNIVLEESLNEAKKSLAAKMVLQLMDADEDANYQAALKKALAKFKNVDKAELEKELDLYI